MFHSRSSRDTSPQCRRLFADNLRRPKRRILIRHPPPQRPLDLRAQRQLAQVIALLRSGLVSLLLEALVL